MKRPRVAIVGGGFAGLACANALDARHFAVTLVDARSHFEFLPNIHELVSGVKTPADLRLPLGAAMRAVGHRFRRARVTAIDPAARRLSLEQRRDITADYVVVAAGAEDADYGVAGVSRHALGFKSVAECEAIRQRLEALARAGGGRVVVIGGGLEGLEALGEILRAYRGRLAAIAIVEAATRLLPAAPAALHRHFDGLARAHGVEVVTGDSVVRLTPRGVVLRSGRRLRSDATIWTGGPAAPALLARSGLAPAGAWAPVEATLRHRDFDAVFVAGDAAGLPHPISKQAYHALDMGACVAANLARAAGGRRLRNFRPNPKPTLLSFGDLDTALVSNRVVLAGPALAAAKEAVYAAVMAGLDRRPLAKRAGAALRRGERATRRLLWPVVTDPAALRRSASLRKLT